MLHSIPEALSGSITDKENAKKFLEEIEQCFTKNEKSETCRLMATLISMKYKGKGNIREYILEMSNIAAKLRELNLNLHDDVLVCMVLVSLPAQFSQFKVSYNTQKEKWTLNELISYYVQEEERIKREKAESANLANTSQEKKKRKKGKEVAEGKPQQKKQKKEDEEFSWYFCKKAGHMKKECSKYTA